MIIGEFKKNTEGGGRIKQIFRFMILLVVLRKKKKGDCGEGRWRRSPETKLLSSLKFILYSILIDFKNEYYSSYHLNISRFLDIKPMDHT